MNDNRTEIFSKCGRGMDGYNWMVEIEDPDIAFEDLVPAVNFLSLDAKILAAVMKALVPNSNLERDIRNTQKEMHKERRVLSGRQALRMVYDPYATNESRRELFNINHFWAIQFKGEAQMESFLLEWNHVARQVVSTACASGHAA